MSFEPIPEHPHNPDCEFLAKGNCYHCCPYCNYDRHICHFCGEHLDHNSYAYENGEKVRHWLSDCRPDLVEHEIGPLCTWQHVEVDGIVHQESDCYAYQDRDTGEFTDEHTHFYRDGKTG